MNVSSIDLNLLVVFDTVSREGSVTEAARQLHLSQSAVSNALGRLRSALDDPLFVRSGRGLTPTPRALAMAPLVRASLEQIERALAPPRFDPATARLTFSVATNDMGALMLLPDIVDRLSREAPGVQLRTLPMSSDVFPRLGAHEADFVFGPFTQPPPGIHFAEYTALTYLCLMRARHPLAGPGPLSREELAGARHLLVSASGDDRGFIDRHLEACGLSRRVVMTVPHFTLVPNVLSRSDLVAVVNTRLAAEMSGRFGLVSKAVPLPIGPVRIRLFWHERTEGHPAHQWMRRVLMETPGMTAGV